VNFGPLTAEIGWRVWDTSNISAGFISWLRYYTDVAQRRSTKLCTMFGRLLGWYIIYIYIFRGSCPLTEFCQVQNSLCIQVLHPPILAVLLHGTRAVGISQTLQRGTRNGITELSQTALFIRPGGHDGGHRPTFLVFYVLNYIIQKSYICINHRQCTKHNYNKLFI